MIMNLGTEISLRKAALIAGLSYILMLFTTPFAEFFVLAKIVSPGNGTQTMKNVIENEMLFRYGLVAYAFNFIGDILAAWSLYILLRPVDKNISILASGIRLVYTSIGLVALVNLVTLLNLSSKVNLYDAATINYQTLFLISSFRSGISFAYIFFGFYLCLLGYLILKSTFISKVVGVMVFLAGAGWLLDSLQPLLFPHITINSTLILSLGFMELSLMFWLLIKGTRLKTEAIDN